MTTTLYQALNLKKKNSVLRSVFITDTVTTEGYRVVIVEPYDNNFMRAINGYDNYIRTMEYIQRKLREYFNETVCTYVRLYVYTYHGDEIIIIKGRE